MTICVSMRCCTLLLSIFSLSFSLFWTSIRNLHSILLFGRHSTLEPFNRTPHSQSMNFESLTLNWSIFRSQRKWKMSCSLECCTTFARWVCRTRASLLSVFLSKFAKLTKCNEYNKGWLCHCTAQVNCFARRIAVLSLTLHQNRTEQQCVLRSLQIMIICC